ncbi:MAG: translation initiation factor IF-3 [Candidatus Magasanikbacteria bacterium]|nr:translation initiation factor IF-3 [Candidatus Magasanikbacteria bacterium]
MRITHRRKKAAPKKIYFYNEGIAAPQVLTLAADGSSLGVKPTAEAIRLARAEGLDLVQINPKHDPPVAKIMDYGQFRYHLEKEARLAKARQHVVDTKGVRLSLRIGKHDVEVRENQTLKFLNGGDKVKIEIMLRGREMQQFPLAFTTVRNFITKINGLLPVRTEQTAERQANRVTAIIVKA